MMQMKDSLARAVLLTCVLWFPSHTHAGDALVQYDPHQLREVEKRLRGYLTSRVLVFRKGEIRRHRITFDSPGVIRRLRAVRHSDPARMRSCLLTSPLVPSTL
jgi:hypothetical protein